MCLFFSACSTLPFQKRLHERDLVLERSTAGHAAARGRLSGRQEKLTFSDLGVSVSMERNHNQSN